MSTLKLSDLEGDTLGKLGQGMFGRVVDDELARITRDLEERGQDGKSRKLAITLEIYYDDQRRRYVAEPSCQAKLPPQKAYPTEMKIEFDSAKRQHVLQFNPNSDEVDQRTIVDGHGEIIG